MHPPFGRAATGSATITRTAPLSGRRTGPARRVSDLQRAQLARGDDVVDEAVLLGPLSREDRVPLDVEPDLLLGLAGVPGQDRLQLAPHPHDLVGLDLQVADLA